MLLQQYTFRQQLGTSECRHILASILQHHNLAKSTCQATTREPISNRLGANFSPLHTVSDAPLSSSERLSIIVAALGALKNSNIPLDIGQSDKCY
jgi:hypothetical protein